MNTKIFPIALLCLFLFSCKSSEETPSELLIKDANGQIYISIFDDLPLPKGDTFFHPTKNEIQLAENLLTKELKSTKKQLVEKYQFFNESETPLPLSEYKRQYYPYVSKNNEKYIYFVGVCNDLLKLYPNWTTKQIMTAGGGVCFFHGVINLSTKKIVHLSVNAPM